MMYNTDMPRTKLSEQSCYEFQYVVTLQPRDINYGGHLGNDSLVSLLGTARTQMFRALGKSEMDVGDGKSGIIMADLVVIFKAEAFMLDELTFEVHIGDLSRTSFRMYYRVKRGQTLIALAETGVAVYDYESKKIAAIPGVFLESLKAFRGGG